MPLPNICQTDTERVDRCPCGGIIPPPGCVIEILRRPEKGDTTDLTPGSRWLVLGFHLGTSSHWLVVTEDDPTINPDRLDSLRNFPSLLTKEVKGVRRQTSPFKIECVFRGFNT